MEYGSNEKGVRGDERGLAAAPRPLPNHAPLWEGCVGPLPMTARRGAWRRREKLRKIPRTHLLFAMCDVLIKTNHTYEGAP